MTGALFKNVDAGASRRADRPSPTAGEEQFSVNRKRDLTTKSRGDPRDRARKSCRRVDPRGLPEPGVRQWCLRASSASATLTPLAAELAQALLAGSSSHPKPEPDPASGAPPPAQRGAYAMVQRKSHRGRGDTRSRSRCRPPSHPHTIRSTASMDARSRTYCSPTT
jgi:hypothetical protein